MFERILKRIREKIRLREYVLTLHAEDEMNDDGYTIYDVEHGILTGTILERQRDKLTAESKYRINGKTVEGKNIETLVKEGPTGKVVIVTLYEP
ncbi:MAG: DUF4258 domain-containing protein [Nitrospira sp.]|nr:DUF4258 domain-containing protein [Nitrospira sp.]